MFCTNCGKEIKDGIKFCTSCGKKQEKLEEEIIEKQDVEEQDIEVEQEYKKEQIEVMTLDLGKKEEKSKPIPKVKKPISREPVPREPKKKKGKKGLICAIIVIFMCIGIGAGTYFFWDDALYFKYKNDLESALKIDDKIEIYNEIINIGKFTKVREEIIKNVESNDRNLKVYDELTFLGKKDKDDLRRDTYIYIAELEEKSGNYKEAKEALDSASTFEGYTPQNDPLYKKLEKLLKEENYDDYYKDYYDKDYYDDQADAKIKDITKNEGYVNHDGYIIPDSNQRYLTREEILSYGKDKIGYLINELYARHGYIFREQPFINYFNSKSWYTPIYKNQEDAKSMFNDYESKNLDQMVKIRGY